MPDFKNYQNSRFSGCRLLAYARDNHRKRDVRIFLIPNVWDCVGVADGVDCWIAPVIADPFSVNIKRLMEDIQAGKEIPKPTPPQPVAKRARVRLIVDDAPDDAVSAVRKIIRRRIIL